MFVIYALILYFTNFAILNFRVFPHIFHVGGLYFVKQFGTQWFPVLKLSVIEKKKVASLYTPCIITADMFSLKLPTSSFVEDKSCNLQCFIVR